MARESEDRHHRSSKSRRRSSTDKDKAESNCRTHQQRAQHKSSPDESGARRSNMHRCDNDRIVVDDEQRRDGLRHRHHRRRRRRSEEGDTRRRDSTTRRGEERDQERRRRSSRKKRQSSHGNAHNSHSSHSSDESDYSSSSASSVSSLSDHFDRQQDKRQREDIPRGGDEGSLDSAYIYVVDGDEREGAKKDDEDTNRRHHRDQHRRRQSRRKSHGHRKDSDHRRRRRRRRSTATTTLDSTRPSDDEGGAGTAAPATSITVKGKDIAQEIIDRRHLELELIDVREQLARALVDKMRLERKAAKLDKTTKFLYQENQDLKNMLADPIMSNGIENNMVPSSMTHEGDIQHEMHMHVPVERKPSSSSTKQPRRQSSLAGHPYADGHGSSLSSAAFDMLHASQEAKLQVQKVQRRHSMTSAGTSSYVQQGNLPGAEQQGSSTSIFSEIPLSVLKTPPPDYYKLSPPSGGTRNRARLLSRIQSGRVSYDKSSACPPVTNVVTVERQRRSSAEGSSSKKIMKMDKSSSERGLRLEVDIENGREDNHSTTKKAQAMMKKAVSERLLFRSSPSSSAAGKRST